MPFSLHVSRVALILASALAAYPAFSATLSYPGASPCNGTLQACIEAADPGDVIELAFDTTNAEALDIRKSVTLRPATGRTPTVTSAMAYATDENIDVTIRSLNFAGNVLGLLGVGGGNLRLQVTDNTFPDSQGTKIEVRTTTAGEQYGSISAIIEGNRLGIRGISDSCADGVSVALYQAGEARSDVVIRNNEITANDLDQCGAILVYQAAGGLDLTVDRNRVQGSMFNNGIELRTLGGNTQAGIYNNLVYGQSGNRGGPGALVVYAMGISDVTAHLINNTVAHNRTGMWVGARTDEGAQLQGSMRNNIAAFNTLYALSYQSDLAPGFVESHNLIHGNGELESPLPPDPFRRTGNPAFINPAAGDYRLSPSSDAINRGQNSALPASFTLDLASASRIIGSSIDIGAYEYPLVITPTPSPAAVTAVPTLGQWALLALGSLMALWGMRRLSRRHY
ncbi:IPTL-CTERM sorting domain-containing protein [Ottowia thiooxydans]|uniref:IPTL-CTERM protein sorting domain-containing protein n=1 Tax=Ottowia thiooxydans TaxID=219182 RepID=A0ABV2Q984_9BURK